MRCVCCNGVIEYRPANTVYENEEDRYICGSCLDLSYTDDFDVFNSIELSEVDYVVYNTGVTPPRWIE